MARYFFHVIDGEFLPDSVGQECKNATAVKAEAVKIAGAMIEDQGDGVWKTGRLDMFVCDEKQKTHLKLSFIAEDLSGELK
jgi:hypothetical protein